MRVQKSLLIALCLSLAAACSKSNGNTPGPDGGADSYSLGVVNGAAVLRMHPGDVHNLKVVLAEANVGPVEGATINFAFDNEDPAGAQLDHPNATTATDGTASVNLTAGATATFKVIVSAPDYPDVSPVGFSIEVLPVREELLIVGSPQVVASQDQETASVTMYKSSSVALKVLLLDEDTGDPIAGHTILFQVGSTAQQLGFSGTTTTSATVITGTTGQAQVFLVSGTVIQTGVQVNAEDQAGGVGAVAFAITVQDNTSGGSCTTNGQCPAGEVCIGGECSANGGGTGGCTAGNDTGCPFGYVCVSGSCVPPTNPNCDPNNPSATCPTGDTCECTGSGSAQVCQCQPICGTCPVGETCVVTGNTGTCTAPPGQVPDLTGIWYTRHSFSIQQALPGFVQSVQGVIRDLDQLIQGQFFSGFWSWLNPIVSGIIDSYVPTWVQTLIEVLDDIGTIFSNLRSIGSMKMTANATDPTQFNGTEVWTSFVFYWLPLCNGQIGGNNYTPACARFDVATTDGTSGSMGTCAGQALPSISVQVAPFAGQLSQASSTASPNPNPWVFKTGAREVSLKMGKLILVAINLLISYLTPYDCLDDALDCSPGMACLIDCPDFGQFIDQVTGGLLDASTAEGICDAAANIAGQALSSLLANISFSADTLDFAGHAVVTADGSAAGDCTGGTGGPCANQLGNDNYDNDLQMADGMQDGWWSGSFFLGTTGGADGCTPAGSGCMPGAWEAERTPANQ